MKIEAKKEVLVQAASLAQLHSEKELKKIEKSVKLARKLRKVWENAK